VKICYEPRAFYAKALLDIERINVICEGNAAQGLTTTSRNILYRFVGNNWVKNGYNAYKRLQRMIREARYAGLIDWDHIVDEGRGLHDFNVWNGLADYISDVPWFYNIDKWADHPIRVEAWTEKDGLLTVLKAACTEFDVPYFSCHGYDSATEIFGAAQRLGRYCKSGQGVVILYLGDHDPSGVHMDTNLEDRLRQMIGHDIGDGAAKLLEVRRIALTREQVDEYHLPPNKLKTKKDGSFSDTRAPAYIAEHGVESWEIDALEPPVLLALLRDEINLYRDPVLWDAALAREDREQRKLLTIADRFAEVCELLGMPS
jgi:hypothetical protein